MFHQNQKRFYRGLEISAQTPLHEPADPENMHRYWSSIWSDPKDHDDTAFWIGDESRKCAGIDEMTRIHLEARDVADALKKLGNWKAPGLDRLHAYWWKNFTFSHDTLAAQLTQALEFPNRLPKFFTSGITYLLPKNTEVQDPKNFRPITCLPVVYKIFTAAIEQKIRAHLDTHNILSYQQNGCRPGSQGSREWLVVDSIITNHARRKKRNLSVAWIDYRKAFDSVPHSWLLRVLGIYKVHHQVIQCLRELMQKWETKLSVDLGGVRYTTGNLNIRRGIFQGDSLSPLWFCLAINPLSTLLESSDYGYVTCRRPLTKISHLLYMDDLKLYAGNSEQLRGQIELVSSFTKAIHMSFGIEKCSFLHVSKGQIQESPNIRLMDDSELSPLPLTQSYKYLGVQQALNIDQTATKHQLENALKKRVTAVLKTELYSKSKINAINAWAIPAVTYSFGVVKWTSTDLERLDRLIRTSLTRHRMHHPKSSTCRLYLSRARGGRGLRNIHHCHTMQLRKLFEYFWNSSNVLYQTILAIDDNISPLNLAGGQHQGAGDADYLINLEQIWREKQLHGRFAAALQSPHISSTLSTLYLTRGRLLGETEGFISAIQDQVIATRNYRRFILGEATEDRCRMCQGATETIQHLSSGCSYLAPRDHKKRHDDVARIIHQAICQKMELISQTVPYYRYSPTDFLENERGKVYWDKMVLTDKEIQHNRPDILVFNSGKKCAYIIDVVIPQDNNILEARNHKVTKYLDLAHEIKDIYQLSQVTIHPIVVSANGLIDVKAESELKKIGVDQPKQMLALAQEAAILGTCRTVRRVLAHE